MAFVHPQPSSEVIAEVLTNWLQEEIINADISNNAFLSNYETRLPDFYRTYDDEKNGDANKGRSHSDRFQFIAEHALADPSLHEDSKFQAKTGFVGLMAVSGAFRREAFLRAGSAEDYQRIRYQLGPTSVDVVDVVAMELESRRPPTLSTFLNRMLKANETSQTLHVATYAALAEIIGDNTIEKPDCDSVESPQALVVAPLALKPVDEPVRYAHYAQGLWLGIATAHVVLSAQLHDGDYTAVPFLEPKSITDASIIYPFAA